MHLHLNMKNRNLKKQKITRKSYFESPINIVSNNFYFRKICRESQGLSQCNKIMRSKVIEKELFKS